MSEEELINVLSSRERTTSFRLYHEVQTEAGTIINFRLSQVIMFWESLGYRKLRLPKGGYELVQINNGSILKPVSNEDLMHAVKTQILKIDENLDAWEEFLSRDFVGKKANLAIDIIQDVNLNMSTQDKSFLFFENGVLEIEKDRLTLTPYEEYTGFLFEEQILNHNIVLNSTESDEKSMFDDFLRKVSGNNELRYNYLTSAIGYLIHNYKDPSFTKAVILVDETLDFSGEANGGTGKSLISRAIAKTTYTLQKDGKALHNKGNRFFYQDLNLKHRVLNLDDVQPDFNFENFYSVVTGDITVEEKYKANYKIPFELSPKLLITSNYMVVGSGGNSDDRRRIEVEIAPHYNGEFTPIDEFGCKLFDDWEFQEWNKFYLDMASYCQRFMNSGVQSIQPINLIENKLKVQTDIAFVEFADLNIVFGEDQNEVIKNKAELYSAFKERYTVESRNVSNIQFKKWLDVWGKSRGYRVHHYKSNSQALVKFLKL